MVFICLYTRISDKLNSTAVVGNRILTGCACLTGINHHILKRQVAIVLQADQQGLLIGKDDGPVFQRQGTTRQELKRVGFCTGRPHRASADRIGVGIEVDRQVLFGCIDHNSVALCIFEQRNDRLARSRFHSLCQGGILFHPLCGCDLGNHHLFPGADLAVGVLHIALGQILFIDFAGECAASDVQSAQGYIYLVGRNSFRCAELTASDLENRLFFQASVVAVSNQNGSLLPLRHKCTVIYNNLYGTGFSGHIKRIEYSAMLLGAIYRLIAAAIDFHCPSGRTKGSLRAGHNNASLRRRRNRQLGIRIVVHAAADRISPILAIAPAARRIRKNSAGNQRFSVYINSGINTICKASAGNCRIGAFKAANNRCPTAKSSAINHSLTAILISQMNGHGFISYLKCSVFHSQRAIVIDEALVACRLSCIKGTVACNCKCAIVYDQIFTAVRKANRQRLTIHV